MNEGTKRYDALMARLQERQRQQAHQRWVVKMIFNFMMLALFAGGSGYAVLFHHYNPLWLIGAVVVSTFFMIE